MGPGRPPKFKQKFCKQLYDHMSKGYSFESFGAKVNCCKRILYYWVDQHAGFLQARNEGYLKSMEWWESQGMEGLWTCEGQPKLNNAIWIFNMKNRFGWSDKSDIDVEVLLQKALKNATPSKKDD